jgi:catechol 2,3-dioxygenase-like lactoylglutathione lyase family enzyme
MINGLHALIYSADADADRAFLRDVLGLPNVDSGGGWLIFAMPPAELGVHPTMGDGEPAQEFYLMCDDLEATMAELTAKGVRFAGDVQDVGYGRQVVIALPGGGRLPVYEPKHPTALDLPR